MTDETQRLPENIKTKQQNIFHFFQSLHPILATTLCHTTHRHQSVYALSTDNIK